MKRNINIFYQFLKAYPLSHALPRGLESILFNEVKLEKPILDLGCGDGSFARLAFGDGKFDVGLDIRKRELEKARQRKVYKKLVLADAHKLPFNNDTFKTIIANSFLEHVADPVQVLSECRRVLKKDGKLIFTTPCIEERKYRFWPRILGRYYWLMIDRLMGHYLFYDKAVWIEKIKQAGFSDMKISTYAPKKTVFLSDFLIPFGLFYKLTGKVFGPRKILAKLFLPYFDLDRINGFGFFVIAKK